MAESVRPKRRWLYLPFAIAAIVFAGYFLLWRAGAAEMKKAIGVWVEDQRAAGYEVTHGALKAEGFPFFLRVHMETPEIADPGAWRWSVGRLTLDALPYDLNRLIFSVNGAQRASIDSYGDWRVAADDFRFSIASDKARGWKFSMTVGGAHASRENDGATATAERFVFDLAPSAEEPDMLVLSLAAAKLAGNAPEGAFHLDGVQTVMAATRADALSDAEIWRQSGGELIINGFNAQRDEAKLSVAGILSLDARHLPVGDLKTEIIAPAPFAKALGELGVLTPDEAESAAAALSLAAIANGGKITAPLEFRDGAAHLAGVTVFKLAD